jgi:hypothetical protein
MKATLGVVLAMLAIAACGSPASPVSSTGPFAFDFNQGAQGWAGFFAPDGIPSTIEPAFSIQGLPAPLDTSRNAFFQSAAGVRSTSVGGGLLMAKRRVDGLRPKAMYDAAFTVVLASNTPTSRNTAFGPLLAPGLYAGVATVEPQTATNPETLSPELTAPAVRLGAVTAGGGCDVCLWTLTTLNGSAQVAADELGQIWLFWRVGDKMPEFGMVAPPFYITSYNVRLTIR